MYSIRPESTIVPATLLGFGYSRKAQRKGKINTSAIIIIGINFFIMISNFLLNKSFECFLHYKDILNQKIKI